MVKNELNINIDEKVLAEALSSMVRVKTLNKNNDEESLKNFEEIHKLYAELFPLFHENTTQIKFDGTMLYKWKGSKADKKPYLLMSHSDIVEAKGNWKFPPFDGVIDDERVWGRGTVDTKGYLCALFSAMELLMQSGFTPEQDIYLLTTHNEETMGDGAPTVAKYFKDNNITFSIVLDEGGAIVEKVMPGLDIKCAMVGTMEKGYGDIKFTAKAKGGHSSAPSKSSPIARLSAFINEVERKNPFKAEISLPLKEMLSSLASYMKGPYKLLFSNLWLTSPILKTVFLKMGGQTAAMLRTTIAFTMMEGSNAPNVIPAEASVIANLRFMIHEGKDKSLEKLEKLAKKYNVEMEVLAARDCTKAISAKTEEYNYVKSIINEVFPEVGVSPYIMLGATDSRHFDALADAVIKFAPIILDKQQLNSVHGIDENIYISSLKRATEFVIKYIVNIK